MKIFMSYILTGVLLISNFSTVSLNYIKENISDIYTRSISSIDISDDDINLDDDNLSNGAIGSGKELDQSNSATFSKPVIIATPDSNETYCNVELSSYTCLSGFVEFAVWSDMSKQKDLIWYKAEYMDGKYIYKVPIKNHGNYGLYYVHAYNVSAESQKQIIDGTLFSISKPSVDSLSVDLSKISDSMFFINYSNARSVSGLKSVDVAVWSENLGQDDCIWYKKEFGDHTTVDSGSFKINIDDHYCDLGNYLIHLYINTENGIYTFIKSLKSNIMFDFSHIEVIKSSDESKATIKMASNGVPAKYAVLFPVWSQARNQSDIQWINSEFSDGYYYCSVNISDFCISGKYLVHAYLKNLDTQRSYYINGSSFDINFATCKNLRVSEIDINSGYFVFEATDIECVAGLGNNSASLYVWSEINGQDDLKLYQSTPIKQADGNYNLSYKIFISNHNYNLGNYYVHLYLKTNNNIYGFINGICANVNVEKGKLQASVDSNELYINIRLINSSLNEKANVQFAVWSDEKGQDDLKWYDASYNNNGTFSFDALISDHKSFGRYNIHCYYSFPYIGTKILTSCTVDYNTAASATLFAPKEFINGTAGTFKIIVDKLSVPSGIKSIELPTWGDNVTSDFANWYVAKKINENTYEYTVNVNMHILYFGTYHTHAYLHMGNGLTKFLGGVTINISPKNYIGIAYFQNAIFKAVAYGLTDSNIDHLEFPTWSNDKPSSEESQDDIIWYRGNKIDDHNYFVNININFHRPAGEHCCDPYIFFKDGSHKFLGRITFNVTEEQFVPGFPLYCGIRNGVDVSEWQKNINWAAVAASKQVGFAMLRVGFGWTAVNGREDDWFEYNYNNARSVGIPVGGYWYSYARNVAEAEAEARTCLSILGGRYMDLPIAFDFEEYDIDYVTNTEMIRAFCNIIASAGYMPMIYASESVYNGGFNVWSFDNNVSFWVAQWSHEPVIQRKNLMRMWQTTSSWSVPGIPGSVDGDYVYY